MQNSCNSIRQLLILNRKIPSRAMTFFCWILSCSHFALSVIYCALICGVISNYTRADCTRNFWCEHQQQIVGCNTQQELPASTSSSSSSSFLWPPPLDDQLSSFCLFGFFFPSHFCLLTVGKWNCVPTGIINVNNGVCWGNCWEKQYDHTNRVIRDGGMRGGQKNHGYEWCAENIKCVG